MARAGEPNHYLLDHHDPVASARTEAARELIGLSAFPAMITAEATAVVGKVYEIKPVTLITLHRIEGRPPAHGRLPRGRRRGPDKPPLAEAGPRLNSHLQQRLDGRIPKKGQEVRIRMMADGRVLDGAAKRIIETMHAPAFRQETRTLSEYADWDVDQVWCMNEIDMRIGSRTDDEKVKSSIRGMLEAGLLQQLRGGAIAEMLHILLHK